MLGAQRVFTSANHDCGMPTVAALICASMLQSFVSHMPPARARKRKRRQPSRGGGQGAYLLTPQELAELKARNVVGTMVIAVLAVTEEEEEVMAEVGMAVAGMVVRWSRWLMEAAVVGQRAVGYAAFVLDAVALLAEAARFGYQSCNL
ncbi:TPA: hypothetical protein ACH3X2_013443 [Trebouxia sp. C0005]